MTVILTPKLRAEARIARRKFMSRVGRATGEDHHNAKLTDDEVVLMRDLYFQGWSLAALSEKFDVPVVTVKSICYGRTRNGGALKERQAALRLTSAMNCLARAPEETEK